MNRDTELFGEIKDLLAQQRLCVLATQGEHGPYTSIVAFFASSDLQSLYFATTKQTTKFQNLLNTSSVSLLIDNRRNMECDFCEAKAATVIGEARVVEKDNSPGIVEEYFRHFPHLKEFLSSPSASLIEVRAKTYFFVERFQSVREYRVSQ